MRRTRQKGTVGPAGPPLKPGEGGYADWLIIALHGLKEHLGHSSRQLMDFLKEMPRIRRRLGLSLDNRRTASETGFRVLKQRHGDRLWARSWYGQYRELVSSFAVKNIEDHVNAAG